MSKDNDDDGNKRGSRSSAPLAVTLGSSVVCVYSRELHCVLQRERERERER